MQLNYYFSIFHVTNIGIGSLSIITDTCPLSYLVQFWVEEKFQYIKLEAGLASFAHHFHSTN